jgi:hypothetical protein
MSSEYIFPAPLSIMPEVLRPWQISLYKGIIDLLLQRDKDIAEFASRATKSVDEVWFAKKVPWDPASEIRIPKFRQCFWIYSEKGGDGKRILAEVLKRSEFLAKKILYLSLPKKENDLGSTVLFAAENQNWTKGGIVFVNLKREDANRIDIYGMITCLIRGKIRKIEGPAIETSDNTVVVFANWLPNTGKNTLSEDRWKIMKIDEKQELIEMSLSEVRAVRPPGKKEKF